MELKNAELAAMVEAANINELDYRVYITEDTEGMPEKEWLEREVQWIIEDFSEDNGHSLYDELRWAKKVLKRTDNGRIIPISIENGFRPIEGFAPKDIEYAKFLVNEYKAIKAFQKKLIKM